MSNLVRHNFGYLNVLTSRSAWLWLASECEPFARPLMNVLQRLFLIGALIFSFSVYCGDAFADQTSEQQAKLKGGSLIGDCIPTEMPGSTWNCQIDGDKMEVSQRLREVCPPEDRIAISDEFKQLAAAESASRALEQLVRKKLKESGLRAAIRWFACQGVFVQMDDFVSGDNKNSAHALMRLHMTILINEKLQPGWAVEVAKWDDMQHREKLWFFSFTSLPTQININLEFSLAGEIEELEIGVSNK